MTYNILDDCLFYGRTCVDCLVRGSDKVVVGRSCETDTAVHSCMFVSSTVFVQCTDLDTLPAFSL